MFSCLLTYWRMFSKQHMLPWTVCSQHAFTSMNEKGNSLLLLHIMSMTIVHPTLHMFLQDSSTLEKCVIDDLSLWAQGQSLKIVKLFCICFSCRFYCILVLHRCVFVHFFHAFSWCFKMGFRGQLIRFCRTATVRHRGADVLTHLQLLSVIV